MVAIRKILVPISENWEWQMRAACRGIDSAVFFNVENERGPDKAARDALAKRVCEECPVIEACRRHALTVQEPYGVWGGMTVAERGEVLHGPEVQLKKA